MRSHLTRLGAHTVIYGLGGVALQLAGVITLPIYARVFDPTEYGVIEIGTVGFAVLLLVIDFGLTSASLRHFYDYADDQVRERRLVLSTAIFTSLAIGIVVAAALLLARSTLASTFFNGRGYTDVVVLVAVTLPVATVANFMREVLRVTERPWHYSIASSAGAIATAAVGVVLVLGFDSGLEGIFVGVLVGQAVTALYGLIVAGPDVGLGFSVPELRGMLAFGLPLIPTAISLWGLSFLDRVMLGKIGNLADVGQYAIAGRFGTVVMFGITAFTLAFSPFIFAIYAEDRELEKAVRARVLTYLAAGLSALALFLSVFSREIASLVAPSFDRAYEVVGLLCFGLVAFGISSVLITGISITRQTKYFAYYTTAAVVLNFGLNLLLIPAIGMFGAAVATALAYLFLTATYYRKAQQLYPTPYEPLKVFGVALLGAALAPVGLLHLDPEWLTFSIKLGTLAIFGAGLLLLGVLGREELAGLRGMLARERKLEGVEVEV